MQYDKKIMVIKSLDKAREAYVDAELALEHDRLNNARSRIYYSLFHTVMALGYMVNYVTFKHTDLMKWFCKHFFYKDKMFDKHFIKIYKEAYINRMQSDFSLTPPLDKAEVEASFQDAKQFIQQVEKLVKNELLPV